MITFKFSSSGVVCVGAHQCKIGGGGTNVLINFLQIFVPGSDRWRCPCSGLNVCPAQS